MHEIPRLRAVFRARVNPEGQLLVREPARWRAWLARHRCKDITLSVGRERHLRSLNANRYLWGVVYRTLAEWSGHDEEELHSIFKERFLSHRQLRLPTGELLEAPGSTAVLDTEQFSEYVSRVKRFAAECGVDVPEPNEVEIAL